MSHSLEEAVFADEQELKKQTAPDAEGNPTVRWIEILWVEPKTNLQVGRISYFAGQTSYYKAYRNAWRSVGVTELDFKFHIKDRF